MELREKRPQAMHEGHDLWLNALKQRSKAFPDWRYSCSRTWSVGLRLSPIYESSFTN